MAHYRKTIAVLGLSTASALALALGCSDRGDASEAAASNLDGASDVVISQIYGGGGNANAKFRNDFIELFNRGKTAVSLKDKSLQIANANLDFGSDADSKIQLPEVDLEPGQYFLVKLRGGGADASPESLVGDELPAPFFEAPLANLTQTAGKVALVKGEAPLEGCGGKEAGACAGDTILDLVGYGGASQFERVPAQELSSKKSALRKGAGCIDTNDNAADFTTAEPPTPRTTKSEKTDCSKQPDASAPPDASSTTTTGVLLNEIRVKPAKTEGGFEFVEVLCPPGAPLDDYYFLSVEGDGDSGGGPPGTVDMVIPLAGKKCGANGLLYIKAATAGTAKGDEKTEVLETAELNAKEGGQGPLENSTNTFLLVKSSVPIEKGINVDPGDGQGAERKPRLPEGATVADGIATFDQKDPAVDITYAPRVTIKFGMAWAMSRFKGNAESLTSSAWYGGRLTDEVDSVTYDRENASTNLPNGALLTPGAENGKTSGTGPSRKDGGARDGSAARDTEDEAEDFGEELEPTPGSKGKKPAKPPKLAEVNDCSMGSGPTNGSSLAAFGTLALALAALKRRRRST
jgi:MYXO-CTERM domain-containing protein